MLADAGQVSAFDFKCLEGKNIVVVGAGGTGCFVLPFLARLNSALTIIDRDVVEGSNLDRQVLYSKKDVGKPKAVVAAGRLKSLSNVKPVFDDFNFRNAEYLIKGADFVFDCTDNIDARLLINDICKKHSKPWVHTSAANDLGEVLLVTSGSACYQCVFGDRHGETCDSAGVMLDALKGVASVAVALCVNFFSSGSSSNGLLRLNAGSQSILEFKVRKNPNCQACMGNFEYLSGNKRFVSKLCGSSRYMISLGKALDLDSISSRLDGFIVKTVSAVITDEFTILKSGRVLVRAASEEDARKKLARQLGV